MRNANAVRESTVASLIFRVRCISLRSIVAVGETAQQHRILYGIRGGTKLGGRQSAKALDHTVERSIYL